eukprot:gene2643-3329_t
MGSISPGQGSQLLDAPLSHSAPAGLTTATPSSCPARSEEGASPFPADARQADSMVSLAPESRSTGSATPSDGKTPKPATGPSRSDLTSAAASPEQVLAQLSLDLSREMSAEVTSSTTCRESSSSSNGSSSSRSTSSASATTSSLPSTSGEQEDPLPPGNAS